MRRHPLPLLTREVRPLDLTPQNTCLLMQDLHAPFADPESGWLARRARQKVVMREFDEYFDELRLVRPLITQVVQRMRALTLPVLYSCLGHQASQPPSAFQQATGWLWNLDGEDGAFPFEWAPHPGEPVFAKPAWGALAERSLGAWLAGAGVCNVVIMGCMLDFGIRQTCGELTDRGIGTLVVTDGTVALTQGARSAVSGNLAHGMTKLRTAAELLDLLDVLAREGSVRI